MKQHEMSENRGLFALAATVVCLTAAISPSFAFGENLINGAFEPRGDEDRTAEVLAAVKSGATLRFAKGEYHFRSPAKLRYYISNHDNPQPHKVFLPVTNVTDLVVNGNGAVFVFHGSGIGLTLMDTRRVTVKGVAFDWARPAFTEAKVTEVDGGNVVIKPDLERFPLAVERGRLIAVGEGWRNHVPIIQAFDGDTLDPVLGISYMGGATALAGGTIRLDARKALRRAFRPLRAGDIALIRSPFRPSPGVSLYRAHDTVLEDCTIHGGDGMGLVAQRCENVTLRGSGKAADRTAGAFARKGSGRATALQADATHFSNCKGLVLVENCFFEATVDDAINVHSTSLMIESVPKPDTLVCRYMHSQSTGFEVFLPGERLRFIKAATLEDGPETVVKEATITDPRHVTIRLADPVPPQYVRGDAVENADWQPAVVFRNNIAHKLNSRAVLVTTPGKTVIEGNLFDGVSSQVIQLEGDASGWYESGACRDVTIRNNVFRNCAFMRGEGIIQIRPNMKDVKAQRERYHRNILIEGNRFETPRIPLLRACSVSNLVWRGNEVIYNNSFPARGNRPFVIDYSEDVVTNSVAAAGPDAVKSLAGEWRVTGTNLSGVVRLPGTLADAKLGRFMTTADWEKDADRRSKGALTRLWQYRGKAVYEREIELTEEEARYPLELVMERVMLHSELAIDGEALGSCDSLAVEHVYPIPPRLTKPGRHTIRLTLDNSNRYNFSEWAHSYGPVMQSVWHGVVGEFALRRQSALRQSRVFASWPANHRLVVEVPESFKAKDLDGNIRLLHANAVPPDCNSVRVRRSIKPSPYRKGFNLIELLLEYEPEAWSEHHPYLYSLVLHDAETDFTHTIRFGFRSVSAHDHAIWINGFKWFMRGNLDCCHFPLTGAPETSVEWWRTTFRKLRNQDGINTIRFHSWTPPKAAFDAADELGMFCVVEAGIWVDRWHTTADKMGFGKPIDGFVQHELRNILERRGNSPSFISLGIGNELGGSDFKVMGKWMNDCRAFDPSRLYLASTAREISPGDDYTTTHRHPEVGMVRGRFRPSTDWDYEDVYGKTRLPVVAHEIGQWPIYVDWKHELAKYTGVMRPYNLEHYRDVAVKSGTERFWPRFCKASAHLNRLMYKDEVESFMRTPSCAGLQLLSVQDFTGQGEALIGWRDSFYDLKPSVYEFSRPFFKTIFTSYAGLARFEKYVWSVGETYKATILVRNGTEEPILEGHESYYNVEDRPTLDAFGESYLHGKLRLPKTIYPGDVGVVGEVSIPLTADMAGKKFMLRFEGNYWPFWVFGRARSPSAPSSVRAARWSAPTDGRAVSMKPPYILETSSFDEAVAALAKGGFVLYTGPSAKSAKSHFKPVYWSTGHFRNANAELSTLGYCVRDDHPALRGFPTEDWADWQWYNLVEGGVKHGIADLPQDIDPIVMPVPDLHYSTKMGMLFELKVGTGRLMVCGLSLSDKTQPEVCTIRKSILSYMESKAFNPTASVDPETFKEAFAPQAAASKLRPAQFRDAPVYIAAAVELDAAERSVDWKKSLDFAEMSQGGYNVSGKGRWGAWRDSTGSFWHGQKLTVTLTGTRPLNGTLWVRFRDPNRNNRSGRGTCEGRAFTVPKHQNAKDGIWWAKLPVMREDFLDGKIELSCEAITGPNLMIDRVVLMEDK